MCNAGSAVGNIIGPLLFKPGDAPAYKPGLSGVLGLFVGALGLTVCVPQSGLSPHQLKRESSAMLFLIALMNKAKEKQRVRHGKPAKMINSSMDAKYAADIDNVDDQGQVLGGQAFEDLTDRQNDEVSPTVLHALVIR